MPAAAAVQQLYDCLNKSSPYTDDIDERALLCLANASMTHWFHISLKSCM